ncbi:MAG: thermonuclease family protein [Tenericutes bacterium]|nr:thermonuclease family protein [Mycoplasmatota bacterium]
MKKVVIIFLFFCVFLTNVNAEKVAVKFEGCVDGDTIKVMLDNKKTTVRFLAIDTPETVHPTKGEEPYGKEASNYTCDKVKNAKKLELEYDEGSTKTDKYSRALAWVFVDDNLLQKDLVSLGYAKVAYLYGDYKYTDELKEIEKTAKSKKLGVWSEEEKTTKKATTTKKVEKEQKDDEESLIDDIINDIKKIIKNLFKNIIKKIKTFINKQTDNIFN